MMSVATLAMTSAGLGTDAFAAALARGSLQRSRRLISAVRVGAVFGLSEGLMCLAGWALGRSFSGIVTAVDHWVAFIVLGLIGAKMIREGLAPSEVVEAGGGGVAPVRSSGIGTVITALGTSVDAAAVGVALSLTHEPAWTAAVIGITSFAMSSAGYMIGPMAGRRLGQRAEIAGGIVIAGIGAGILYSHVSVGGWF